MAKLPTDIKALARVHTETALRVLADLSLNAIDEPKTSVSGDFYIYAILDGCGAVAYIGKGSGNRFASQKRRFGFDGRIIKRCKDEDAAYRDEVKFIKRFNPPLNKNCGGAGGVSGKGSTKEERLMNRIGVRAYAARILVWAYFHPNKELSSQVPHEKIDEIRQVAYG